MSRDGNKIVVRNKSKTQRFKTPSTVTPSKNTKRKKKNVLQAIFVGDEQTAVH